MSATWHDHVIATKITSRLRRDLPKARSDSDYPSVHVLTGQEQWVMTMWMLASFLLFTKRTWNIFVHDDGTLSDSAASTLLQTIDGCKLIPRSTADATMRDVLSEHAECVAYRSQHPLAVKCFDIPYFAPGDRFILLDSDVLFYRTPDKIIEWAENPKDHTTWFNRDCQEPSPISSTRCLKDFGFALWPQVNSGLCLISKEIIAHEKFEFWLQHPLIKQGNPWRKEQTLLALAASESNQGGILPPAYEVSLSPKAGDSCTARHYIGAVRNYFYSEGIRRLKGKLLLSE